MGFTFKAASCAYTAATYSTGKKKPAPENRYRLIFQKPDVWLFGCAGKI